MTMALSDQVIRRFLLDHVAEGSRVLDVGCGGGWAALLIARERPACIVHGTDSEAGTVHRANRGFRRRRSAVRCYPCAAEDLVSCFGRSRYDAVVSVHALHHYADPFRALRNMRNVVRREGFVLIAEFEPRYGERLDDCPRYSLEKIRWLCEDAGLRLRSEDVKRPGVIILSAERA